MDATTLDGPSFANKYDIAPAYMTHSNPYFEVIGRLAPKWNRAVFYDGRIFHCGDIQNNHHHAYLSGMGRLTLNAFFKSEHRAVTPHHGERKDSPTNTQYY